VLRVAVVETAWREKSSGEAGDFWLMLVVCQIALGVWTVWSNKAADVATAHVLLGALSLVTGALWCVIAFGRREGATEIAPAKTISDTFGTPPAMAANK